MRSNPQLIERVLGQMEADDANTRGIAFETARRMLKSEGITFRDLHAAYVAQIAEKAERDRRAASAPQPTPSARRASPPRRAPRENVLAKSDGTALYVHKPRVGMFTRRVDGLKVVRNRKPPTYAQGVLRILEDRIVGQGSFGPRHRMKLSFQTDGVLYEPFFEEGDKTDWVAQIHRLSADGDRIIY
jgi:hypothetical protein